MSLKKFIVSAVSIVMALTLGFLTNILVRSSGGQSGATRIALSYFATTTFPDGQSATDNVWVDMIKEELGFEVAFDYALPTSQYETRTNTVIGDGDIPDMFQININQISLLERAGLIYDDLTSVYENNASALTKEKMGWDDTLKGNSPNFKMWMIDGKLKAIPYLNSESDSAYVMYIRKDWLDKVGEDSPQTIEDLEIVLTKFKENGLGKGLGLNEDILFTNAGSANFIFNMYGAYPSFFVEDENGKADFGFFRPEMKDALKLMRNWYSKGLIYQEFATTTSDTLGQKIANGEIGIWYGTMSLPLWKTASSVANIEGCDWVCVPAPALDKDTPTKIGVNAASSTSYVVKKGYKNPERLIQMINLFMENMYGEEGNFEELTDIANAYPFRTDAQYNNLYAYKDVKAAMDADRNSDWFTSFASDEKPPVWTGDAAAAPKYYSVNSEQQFYYRNARNFLLEGKDSQGKNWAYTRIFYSYEDENGLTMLNGKKGFDCAHSVIEYYYDNDLIERSLYTGVDTETYAKYRRTLESNISQMLKFIIKGEHSLSYFDQQVAGMRKGTAGIVVKEINDVLGLN